MPRRKKQKVVRIDFGEGVPMPPEGLPKEVHDLWFTVVMELQDKLVLKPVALPQIVDYCKQWYIYQTNIDKAIGSDNPGVEIFSNGNRGICKNYTVSNEARKRMEIFEKSWGFNPLSANKIELPEPEPEGEEALFDL
jgi:phage terminase small subunit